MHVPSPYVLGAGGFCSHRKDPRPTRHSKGHGRGGPGRDTPRQSPPAALPRLLPEGGATRGSSLSAPQPKTEALSPETLPRQDGYELPRKADAGCRGPCQGERFGGVAFAHVFPRSPLLPRFEVMRNEDIIGLCLAEDAAAPQMTGAEATSPACSGRRRRRSLRTWRQVSPAGRSRGRGVNGAMAAQGCDHGAPLSCGRVFPGDSSRRLNHSSSFQNFFYNKFKHFHAPSL